MTAIVKSAQINPAAKKCSGRSCHMWSHWIKIDGILRGDCPHYLIRMILS